MPKSKHFAVIGKPVLHSSAPQMFNAVFKEQSLRFLYTRLHANNAGEAMSLAKELKLSGFNVTSPFKEAIAAMVDEKDEISSSIGAVNTVVFRDGKSYGYNTDIYGVSGALKSVSSEPAGKKAVILGAGGAAKAAAYALIHSKARDVCVINRTESGARKIAGQFNCRAGAVDELEKELGDADILVSCLPVNVTLVKPEWLSPSHVLLDANYASPSLLTVAEAAGSSYLSGFEWLLYQGVPSFEHFCGVKPGLSAMREAIETGDSSKANIALVGFMGCGKTSVGKYLAIELGCAHEDTDRMIESRAGAGIREIFAGHGEEHFRELEKSVIKNITGSANKIYSLGGGAVLDWGNREIIRRNCLVIFLWTSAETSLERLGNGARPLLSASSPTETAQALFAERLPHYLEISDLVLSAEDNNPEIIARELAGEIRQARKY